MKKIFFALAVVVFTVHDVYASTENMFLGLSTEVKLSDTGSGSMEIEQIDEVVAFELINKPVIRFRAGAGYFPDQPFSFLAGFEIPVFERLSRFNTRMFGVYLISDVRFNVAEEYNTIFEPSVFFLIPLNMIGGISFGIGMDTGSGVFIKVSYFSGGYLQITQKN